MSSAAITVDGVSKQYQIGLRAAQHTTLREAIVQTAKAPFERLRRLAGRHRDEETFWALKDVSFEVQPGEVVGIIGRNGAGKSTLLKVLSRITEPTEGEVRIRGRVASLLEVGTGFHSELTGRENIYLNGSILGMSRAEMNRKFDEIVDFSGVEKFLDTPVKRYSSGMKIRLGFAVAANLEPEILIIDEVLAVGDFEFQKKCLGKMNDVAKSGRTVLFVSHNMAAVEALCTTAIMLEQGSIAGEGECRDVIHSYLSKTMIGGFSENLGDHSGRAEKFQSVMQKFRILNSVGEPVESICPGDDIQFELTLNPEHSVRYLRVAIRIRNSLGQRVTTCHNDYQHNEIWQIDKAACVRCTMNDCRLAPGRYSIELQVDDNQQVLDKISDGLFFTVEATDVYGTGRIMPSHAAIFLPNVTWRIESLAEVL